MNLEEEERPLERLLYGRKNKTILETVRRCRWYCKTAHCHSLEYMDPVS